MKRYLLCALAVGALALNVEAKDKEKAKYNGPVVSVPDNGSTAALLGTVLLVLGIASGASLFTGQGRSKGTNLL
jgi:hypothetical protein